MTDRDDCHSGWCYLPRAIRVCLHAGELGEVGAARETVVGMVARADLKRLEQVFEAEINNRLPYQPHSRSKHNFQLLAEQGLIEPDVSFIGMPPFRVEVHGWQLTQAGRIAYCESCKDVKL